LSLHFNPHNFNPDHFQSVVPSVSSRLGRILMRAGDIAGVFRVEAASIDDYGNQVISYSNVCYTYVALRILRPDERFLIPGTTETAEAIGIFEPDIEVAKGYRIVTLENGSWQVLYVKKVLAHGKVHHIEAVLKRVEL